MTQTITELQRLMSTVDAVRDRLVAAIVHLNDTYLIQQRQQTGLPGFPRVIATIRRLRQHVIDRVGEDRTLVVHSGDFLGPSRLARRDHGKSMVELLNRATVDLCVLGNHEFDHGEQALVERMREARFKIVMCNVDTDVVPLERLTLWPNRGSPLIAITGVVSESVHRAFGKRWNFADPVGSLVEFATKTRDSPFHIVLSHASRLEDRLLRRTLPSRSYVLGGHDHDIDWVEDDGPPVFKNRANMETVRVLLLLAAGGSVLPSLVSECDHLFGERIAHVENELDEIRKGESSDKLPRFPNDVDMLLARVHQVDAAVYRRWFSTIDIPPGSPLTSAIFRLPNLDDDVSFLLRWGDHAPEDEGDLAFVAGQVSDELHEQEEICDLSNLVKDIDLRDEVLRRDRSDFAEFCAECVRRATASDMAILNAGSFRIDAIISPVIRLADLNDLFLYDRKDAVVVIELPGAAINHLITYGRRQTGKGAFPQISPARVPTESTILLAIVSYLVMNASSIDGYQSELAVALGLRDAAELREYLASHVRSEHSIIKSIQDWSRDVSYIVQPVKDFRGIEEEFISLANVFVKCLDFRANSGVPFPWDRVDRIFSQDDVLEDRELQSARDALRAFVRRLPDVREYEQRFEEWKGQPHGSKPPQALLVASTKARSYLDKFRSALDTHPERFRTRIAYGSLCERAAIGVGGWQW